MRAREIITILAMVPMVACTNDDAEPTINIGFADSQIQVEEDFGEIIVPLELSESTNQNMEISFEVSSESGLNAEYRVLSESPLLIPAGQTATSIILETINDSQLEFDEEFDQIEISLISTDLAGINQNNKQTIEILNNDELAQSTLQIDLTWDIGANIDVNEVDLNLALAFDVIIEDGEVVQATFYKEQYNNSGFETLILEKSDPDTEYYVAVFYDAGNADVTFKLNIKSDEVQDSFTEKFEAEDLGFGTLFGILTLDNLRRSPELKNRLIFHDTR